MTVHFFDSSALVKRYIQEPGTTWVQAIAHPGSGHVIYVARITSVEICAAIARSQRGGAIAHVVATASLDPGSPLAIVAEF